MDTFKNILLWVLVMSSLVSCGETIESTWKSQPLVVDGNGKDWEGLPLQYQEEMNLVYGVVNDDSSINFMVRFNDQRLAHTFAMRGFTVWINAADQEEKILGIHYKDENLKDLAMSRRFNGRPDRDRGGNISQQVPEPKGQFTLAKNDSLMGIPIKETAGFFASAGYQDGLYCYEFSIPLTQVNGSIDYLKISDANEIKIGLEISGLSEDEKKEIEEQMAERKGSGMRGGGRGGGQRGGGMRGSGMRGGGMRGGNRSMPDMNGQENWISVTLAGNPE
jgi:hypothetical protein